MKLFFVKLSKFQNTKEEINQIHTMNQVDQNFMAMLNMAFPQPNVTRTTNTQVQNQVKRTPLSIIHPNIQIKRSNAPSRPLTRI
jgi:hypothetical protein